MRVVLVNRYAVPSGGAERHALALAGLLRERGHEARFLSTADPANAEREGAFIPTIGTDFWRGPPGARERLAVASNAVWNRRAAAATRALVQRFRPDVVHLHDIYPQLSVAPVREAARLGAPIVQTLHNYELISASPVDDRGAAVDRGSEPTSVRALRTVLHGIRQAVHVPRVCEWIAVSRFVAAAYAQHGVSATVLENFVAPSPERPRAYGDRAGAVFLGRLTEEKGARDLVELARLAPELQVTVAGRGPLADELRAAADGLANLELAGFVDAAAAARLLRTARVALVPSRWQEPAGLVALEAMAEGTPVVAYERGGLAEYVRSAGGGVVVAPDAGELARVARELAADRNTWERLSVSGRRSVEQAHSPRRYVERLEAIYARAAALGVPAG
jgi:glycosyltransferase involved in cell wall biosynthesis